MSDSADSANQNAKRPLHLSQRALGTCNSTFGMARSEVNRTGGAFIFTHKRWGLAPSQANRIKC